MIKKILFIVFILFLVGANTAHAYSNDISISDIDITPSKIYEGDIAQITVDFDIETSDDDAKVTLSFYIDGDLEKKATRYYSEGLHSYTYSYDTEDMTAGTHTVEIVAKIYRGTSLITAQDSATEKFSIDDYSAKAKDTYPDLTMNIYPENAIEGDNIHVFGYVDPTDELINILIDGIPKRTTAPNTNGYYSTFVKISETGSHIITASVKETKKHKTVNIAEKPIYIEPAPEKPDCNIIITITMPEPEQDNHDTEDIPDSEFQYITVEVSNKEIDVNQYESNIVKVTITNHENKSHLFSIDTDFSDKIVFTPQPEVIKSGKSKIMPLYFSVDEKPGRYYGIIYVRNEEKIVKEIPLTLFVSENEYIKETENRRINNLFIPQSWQIIYISLAIVAVILILGITHRIIKKTVRPLELSDIEKPSINMLKRLNTPIKRAGTANRAETAYLVPWSNIIV